MPKFYPERSFGNHLTTRRVQDAGG